MNRLSGLHLALHSTVVTTYTHKFNIILKKTAMWTYIYHFRPIFRINNEYFTKYSKPICLWGGGSCVFCAVRTVIYNIQANFNIKRTFQGTSVEFPFFVCRTAGQKSVFEILSRNVPLPHPPKKRRLPSVLTTKISYTFHISLAFYM